MFSVIKLILNLFFNCCLNPTPYLRVKYVSIVSENSAIFMMINYNCISPVTELFSCNKVWDMFRANSLQTKHKLVLLMVNTITTLSCISHHWLLSQQKASANRILLVCHYRNAGKTCQMAHCDVDSHWVHKQSNKPCHQQRNQATTLDLLLYLLHLLQT